MSTLQANRAELIAKAVGKAIEKFNALESSVEGFGEDMRLHVWYHGPTFRKPDAKEHASVRVTTKLTMMTWVDNKAPKGWEKVEG